MRLHLKQILIKYVLSIFITLLSLCGCDVVFADTITVQQGTSGYSGAVSASFDPGSTNKHWTFYGWVRFSYVNAEVFNNLSSVLTSSNVTSATLYGNFYSNFNSGGEVANCGYLTDPDSSGSPTANTVADEVFSQYSNYGDKLHATTEWDSGLANNVADVMVQTSTMTIGTSTGLLGCDVTAGVQYAITQGHDYVTLYIADPGTNNVRFRNSLYSTVAERPYLEITCSDSCFSAGGGGSRRRIIHL